MKSKQIVSTIIFGLMLSAISVPQVIMTAPAAESAPTEEMDREQLRMMAKVLFPDLPEDELEAVVGETIELDKQIKSLPPEQQKELESEIAKAAEPFFNEIIKELEQNPELLNELDQQLAKEAEAKPVEKAPTPKPAETQKAKTARDQLRQVLARLDQTIASLFLKLGGLLRVSEDNQVEIMWQQERADLEDLVIMIKVIIAKDKLLNVLLTDEFKLLNSELHKLESALTPAVTAIATADIDCLKSGAAQCSPATKKAINSAVTLIDKQLIQPKMVWSIKGLIQKYAPEEIKKLPKHPERKEAMPRPGADQFAAGAGRGGAGYKPHGGRGLDLGPLGGAGAGKGRGIDTSLDFGEGAKGGAAGGAGEAGKGGAKAPAKKKEEEDKKKEDDAKAKAAGTSRSGGKLSESGALKSNVDKDLSEAISASKEKFDNYSRNIKAAVNPLNEATQAATTEEATLNALLSAENILNAAKPTLGESAKSFEDVIQKLNKAEKGETATGVKKEPSAEEKKANINAVADYIYDLRKLGGVDRLKIVTSLKNLKDNYEDVASKVAAALMAKEGMGQEQANRDASKLVSSILGFYDQMNKIENYKGLNAAQQASIRETLVKKQFDWAKKEIGKTEETIKNRAASIESDAGYRTHKQEFDKKAEETLQGIERAKNAAFEDAIHIIVSAEDWIKDLKDEKKAPYSNVIKYIERQATKSSARK